MTSRSEEALTRARRLVLPDPYAVVAVLVGLAAIAWYAAGPEPIHRPLSRAVLPFLTAMAGIVTLRVSRAPQLPPAAVRFWRTLAVALSIFTAGLLVDLDGRTVGELVLNPVAAAITLWALATYPTLAHTRVRRLTHVLDLAIVLLGTAAYVWYLVASRRWHPYEGLDALADALVLPAIAVVGGFVFIRIKLSGSPLMCCWTVGCLVFGAVSLATAIVIGPDSGGVSGRVASAIHVIALVAGIIGVSAQRRVGLRPGRALGDQLRRLFAVLPYAAIATAVILLAVAVRHGLDYRDQVVVVAVIVLCAIVLARQAVALFENTRLLRQNRELTGQLARQAYTDELTGLANRARFAEQVERALAEGGATVLFVDLDDFKVVNDSLGHHAGDQLLRAVAGRLRAAVEDRYTLGRLGGDEFAVLVPGVPDGQGPLVAGRVVEALDGPFRVTGMQVRVTASVGIAGAAGPAVVPAGTAGPDIAPAVGSAASPPGAATGTMELLRNADIAMYAAKGADKGRWRRFEPAMLTALQGRHRLQAALVQAVERDEFVVFYQPIVNLVDGSMRGAEALVRWRRPDGLLVEPTQFIALAEETGLIAEIDRRVLTRACGQMAYWQAAGGEPLNLHVNVSARQLHRHDLSRDVGTILAASGLPPDRLTLEITESGLGSDPEAAIDRLGELAGLGVHLAIDDFGTGYSSLAYLRRMPVDVLKIDKTFVDELAAGGGAPLVQAVIALAETLGMQTVAEGIEHPTQVRRLLGLGCRYGQGFHYARPLPTDGMAGLVDRPQETIGVGLAKAS